MPREGPKRGYAIIIRQALKRWRGPQEAGGGWSSLLSFQVFFSFFFLLFSIVCNYLPIISFSLFLFGTVSTAIGSLGDP